MASGARGVLIAFEGLDQSGKQTQAERLRDRLVAGGREVRLVSFPDYDTPIGREIGQALRGERTFGPDVMQLLYVANRHEWKPEIERATAAGAIIICDRYLASSIAYGEALGLDPAWLAEIQRFLPRAAVTLLLDIPPEVSAQRKTSDRDRYERDLALLGRVRASYHRQAAAGADPAARDRWVRFDAARDRDAVSADVWAAIAPHLR